MQHAKAIAKLVHEFSSATRDEKAHGFEVNEFGRYDCAELRERLVSAYIDYISQAAASGERSGAAYSLAALLKGALQLDRAKVIIHEHLDSSESRRALPFMNLRARIAAIEGDESSLAAFRAMLLKMNAPPIWRLSDEEVEKERRKRELLHRTSL